TGGRAPPFQSRQKSIFSARGSPLSTPHFLFRNEFRPIHECITGSDTMTLTALTPWHALAPPQQSSLRRSATTHRGQPAADILETVQHYEIQLDLPGVKADQVNVELEDNTLKIGGEKVRSQSEAETYRYKERVAGTFARQFRL